jgi:selenide,water dikinase
LSNDDILNYDLLSINTGSTPIVNGIPGAKEHGILVKPVSAFLKHWAFLIERVRKGEVRRIAVVGGGAAGVETLLAMQFFLAHQTPRREVEYHLLTDAPHVLAQHPHGVRARVAHNLARKAVQVHCGLRVTRVNAQTLIARDAQDREQHVAADATVWVTGAEPPPWLASSDLALNDKKFINQNKYLQSTSHKEIFAAGDCATVENVVYPKSGVYAVRQGPVLARNLRAALNGQSEQALQIYTPQSRALALISTGERHAIASWGPLAFHGNWVWRWKDSIDRAFMGRYRD